MKRKIKNIVIIGNIKKRIVVKKAKEIVEFLTKKSINVFLIEDLNLVLNNNFNKISVKDVKKQIDLILVLGGDGTFLYAARLFYNTNIPMVGINFGNLGFLNEIRGSLYKKFLSDIIKCNFNIEKRMMLDVKIGEKGNIYHCLNEVVISREALSRILKIKLFINEKYVGIYKADGIIVSTPTGSTAYSLSAHGPIISPSLESIIINPICPHSLGVRPMVVSPSEKIKIEVEGIEEKAYLTVDGQKGTDFDRTIPIYIRKSKYFINLITTPEYNFYELLGKKFNWIR